MLTKGSSSVLVVWLIALACAAVQAELMLVEDFDGMALGSPDGQACTGVMGGTWDTQIENTGNINLLDFAGSRLVTVIGHSSGNNARGIAFNGITNPIDDDETGIASFRFMLRSYIPWGPRERSLSKPAPILVRVSGCSWPEKTKTGHMRNATRLL